MSHRSIARLVALVPFAALLVAACDSSSNGPFPPPAPLASITVTPVSTTLPVTTSQQFTAVGRDAAGNVVSFTPAWDIVSGGGSITSLGLLTAGTVAATFTNTVKASSGTITGFASLTVTPGPLASITVAPSPTTLQVNATRQFTATGQDAYSNVVSITPTWSVVAGGGSAVTPITSAGLFTAGTVAGTYTNTATASVGSVSGSATVTVTAGALAAITVAPSPITLALGATQTFTATGQDANGNAVSVTPTWSVVASVGGGTINSGSGLFTAGIEAGTFANTVKACSTALCAAGSSVSGFASVTVTAGGVATITVTPTLDTLAIGANRQFTAVVKDGSGNTLDILPNWSVAALGGTITSTGLFTAGTVAGTFTETVRASVGSSNGSATVTVSAGALETITVTPNPKILAIDSTQQFTVEGRDAFGNTVSITPTWSVVASGGTIDNAGLFKAGTVAGTFPNTVRACSTALCAIGSVFGFATVTVSSGVLATITVSPNPAAVGTDASQPFTAVGRDADGNIIAISPAPTWSVLTTFAGVGAVTPAGGTILSPSGVYTAPTLAGSGIDSVQACSANPCVSGSVFGFAEVNVSASGALVSIAVTPNPASVGASGPVQFTATGFDATGLIVPTPGLAWSVVPSQSAAGTIDGLTGLLTAGAVVGTYTNAVKALSGTISGFATVTVTAASLIDFGAAAPNGIMAGTAVTCINNGLIQADVSVSPGNTITGFGPCVITGVLHLADAVALAGQNDLTTAYNTLQALPCPPANAIVADLGGTTKAAGVYCTASSIGVTGVVTLDGGGDPNANFVFQAGTSIITAGDVVLINGAQAKNVYWVSGSSVTLGTASQFKGNVVALTSITLVDTANLIGRALARNGAVSLGTGNTITLP